MKRSALVVAVLVVVGTLSAFPVSGMALTADSDQAAANNTTIAPGERLSGVVGVQEAELDGEIRTRALDIAFERADDNASKAEVIARESSNLSQRLDELEERKAELQEARENGSMSEGAYRARVAKLAVELNTTRELAQETENASEGLPEDVLAANGVNVTAIRTLQERAEELSGPEVAAIAKSIAGNERGEVPAQARGDRGDRGDGEDTPENASEAIARAEQQVQAARERIQQAEQRVNDTNASENATEALERAKEQLSAAEEALSMARNASEDGDEERAMELAQEANQHAEDALESANEAIQAAEQQQDGQDGETTATPRDGSDQDGETTATPTPREGDGDDGGY